MNRRKGEVSGCDYPQGISEDLLVRTGGAEQDDAIIKEFDVIGSVAGQLAGPCGGCESGVLDFHSACQRVDDGDVMDRIARRLDDNGNLNQIPDLQVVRINRFPVSIGPEPLHHEAVIVRLYGVLLRQALADDGHVNGPVALGGNLNRFDDILKFD